ncbi:MAG: hypothetical protein ACAI34_25760, partial [Verrucomicrobium sp.]
MSYLPHFPALLSALSLGGLLLSGPSPVLGADAKDVFEKVAPSTVLIQSADTLGTGIILTKEGLILTSYKVVVG